MEEGTIDNKHITVTPKLIYLFLFFWTTTVGSVMGTYFSLKAQFKDNDQANAIQDLRIDALRTDIATLRNSIEVNKQRLDTHEKELSDHEARIYINELKLKQ